MIVHELIELLKTMPQDAKIMKSSSDGCCECNPECMDIYHSIYAPEFKEYGDYPNHEVNVVVL